MRRELKLDDFEVPPLTVTVVREEDGGKQQRGDYTDQFKMLDMKVETLIRNSQKTSIDLQVTPSLIQKDIEQDFQKSNVYQNNTSNEELQLTDDILRKVQRFLRKTTPLMQKELAQNLPLYSSFGKEQGLSFKRESRLLHTLQNLENQEKLDISAVSWNASGVIIAAGYAKYQHDTTCAHKSMVCLWGIFKRNFKTNKPEVISVPNCVNALSFHPKKPSIFAVGTYTGEVLLYDFSRKQEPLLGKTIVQDYFHKDCITKISWWAYRPPGKIQTNHNLLSLGSDGKILLWQVPNQALSQDSKIKTLLKYPIKGFLMLRKKENVIIPVSGLTMSQSYINRNIFIVGSEGGSVLRATLAPINHHANSQGKLMLDLNQGIKFKPPVYPFLLNLLPKNIREVKSHIQKICKANKIDQIDNVGMVLNTRPQLRNLYPNPITYAYQPMAYPISSISYNKYGLFIANGGQGYSRIYSEKQRQHLQSIEEGYQWAWINGGTKIAGFIDQEFVVIDWLQGKIQWSVAVGQPLVWSQSNLNMIGVICDKTKLKVLQLGDKIVEENEFHRQKINLKIQELLSKD